MTALAGTASFDDVTWTMTIQNANSVTVRTVSGSGVVTYTWDGRDASNVVQPDGTYTASVNVTEAGTTIPSSAGVTIDTIPAIAAITAPTATTLSNVYQNASADVAVSGNASDANITNWTLDYSATNNPNVWTTINTGTSAITNAQLGLWQTLGVTNGTYTLRLRTFQGGGTFSTATVPVTIGNFKVTQNVYQFNASGNQTITYTSIVPFTLTETLLVRNEAGALVRTVFNAQRTAGTYTDVWNGKNDSAVLQPDGAYAVTANVTDGTHTILYDGSSMMRNTTVSSVYPAVPATFDPYNNTPLAVTYSLSDAYRVSIEVGIGRSLAYGPDCAAIAALGTVCINPWQYKASGTYPIRWWGTNTDGSFLTGKGGFQIILRQDNFPQNVVVVYGTAPTITNEAVSPPFFNPGAANPALNSPPAGTQTISFTLGTYQNQPATITVRVVNQSTISTLRTITVPSQAAGPVTMTWDGLADNGMWVAPGPYTLIVSATDGLGNTTTQHIVTTVDY